MRIGRDDMIAVVSRGASTVYKVRRGEERRGGREGEGERERERGGGGGGG